MICRFVLRERWAGGGNASARCSEPLRRAAPRVLAWPSSLWRKHRVPFLRVRAVNKEKITAKLFFDVKILSWSIFIYSLNNTGGKTAPFFKGVGRTSVRKHRAWDFGMSWYQFKLSFSLKTLSTETSCTKQCFVGSTATLSASWESPDPTWASTFVVSVWRSQGFQHP